jgi:peroxiredoxin
LTATPVPHGNVPRWTLRTQPLFRRATHAARSHAAAGRHVEAAPERKNEFRAVREEDARAGEIGTPADPERHTTVADASEPFRFSFPDLTGRIVANTDPQFAGKVVLVNISGSWCPNCHDEAPFLASLYHTYHRRGLEVVTLAFEEQEQLDDPVRHAGLHRELRAQAHVPARRRADQLNEKVPQAVNLDAFPTTFIVGRDGRVRSVHAGFPGPGSGEFYRKARHEPVVADRAAARRTARDRP